MIRYIRWLNDFGKQLSETAYSMCRIILGFSLVKMPDTCQSSNDCLVLGNGPSLKCHLENIALLGNSVDVFCVNFFANDPYFCRIKPEHYVLLDPMFWLKDIPEDIANKRKSLFENLFDKTKWNMNVYMPTQARKAVKGYINPNIKVIYFNRTPVTGFKTFRHFCYRLNLGMPVPQNVLVAAIFLAVQLKFKNVYVLGADHSWHRELVVGDDNVLYVKQVHFHGDDVLMPFFKPGGRDTFKVHEIFNAWSRVFRSYFHLRSYAQESGTAVFNASQGSFIDAFDRSNFGFKQ